MNISNKHSLSNRYNQPSHDRTRSWCKQLKKENSIDKVLKTIKETYLPISANTNIESRQVTSFKDLYTNENINKENEAINFKIKRKKYENLYEESLKTVDDYLRKNKDIDDETKFFLYLFKAKILSHLNDHSLAKDNYNEAELILNKAVADKASWMVDQLSYRQLETILIKGKRKHEILSLAPVIPKIKTPCTAKDALLSKTHIGPGFRKKIKEIASYSWKTHADYQRLGESKHFEQLFNEIFQSLESTRFSKLVGQLNALDALEHPRFSILFCSRQENLFQWTKGRFNMRNTVQISTASTSDVDNIKKKIALFHELTHRTMQQVFDNDTYPYFKNDELAKKAYRDSMKKVIINIIHAGGVKINNLEALELNELIEICFGEKSLVKTTLMPAEVAQLFARLHTAFQVYQVGEMDSEFITNATDNIINLKEGSGSKEVHAIIQPLMDYIDAYVVPEIEKYIEGHPRRDELIG